MKLKDLCVVIIRILGILSLIESFALMQSLYIVLSMPEQFSAERTTMIIAQLIPCAILFLSGFLLIIFSRGLARIVVTGSDRDSGKGKWTLKEIQAILFSVVGVFIFSISIPRSVTWVSQLVDLLSNDSLPMPYRSAMTNNTWTSIVLNIIQMAVGIYLFFGADNLSNIWHRIREWTPKKEISKHTDPETPRKRKAADRRSRRH
jgi:hypothetical protein